MADHRRRRRTGQEVRVSSAELLLVGCKGPGRRQPAVLSSEFRMSPGRGPMGGMCPALPSAKETQAGGGGVDREGGEKAAEKAVACRNLVDGSLKMRGPRGEGERCN